MNHTVNDVNECLTSPVKDRFLKQFIDVLMSTDKITHDIKCILSQGQINCDDPKVEEVLKFFLQTGKVRHLLGQLMLNSYVEGEIHNDRVFNFSWNDRCVTCSIFIESTHPDIHLTLKLLD